MPKPGVTPGSKIIREKTVSFVGSHTGLADTGTDIAHGLGTIPKYCSFTTTNGDGYAVLTAKSATSITVKKGPAGTGTIDIEYKLEA